MKKLLIICLLSFTIFALGAKNINIPKGNMQYTTDGAITTVEFTLPDYTLQEVTSEGQQYLRISTEHVGEYALPGYPEVPCYSTLVAVPNQGRIVWEACSSELSTIDNILLYPRQHLQSESQPPLREFVLDNKVYSSSELFPLSAAQISEPVIMRDYRLVRVTFNPFQYNPAGRQLIINEKISISISATQDQGINEITRVHKPSQYFDKLYSSTVINYESSKREEEFQKPCILYIYYNNSTVEDYLQYLVDYRRQKGFEVHMVSTAIAGNNTTTIQSYIQDAYDQWDNPPEFVCLVGDGNGSYNIPCYWIDTGETDNNFVMLDGNDFLPDAAIGRIPFENTSQLATIITKIMNYETDPYLTDTDWFTRGTMVGDPSTSGITCIDSKLYVEDIMAVTAPNVSPVEIFDGDFSSDMQSALNTGCVYFNYRGFGDFSGYSTYMIDSLTNGWQLPIVVFLTCGTGSYAGYSDCMSERFVKAGSVTNPKGAVAAISTATSLTHTAFNNCMDMGIWAGVFVDENWNMGMGLTRGKLAIYNTYPDNPANQQHQFISWNNLMGDPSMEIWSDIPSQLDVSAAAEINPAMQEIEIQVFSENEPVENAWVTLLDEEDNSVSAFSESSGSAWVDISELTPGDIILTVSGHNYVPYQQDMELFSANDYVDMSIDIIDSASGNNNGLPEPGESIELEITITNYTQSTLSDLSLTADSPVNSFEFITNSLTPADIAPTETLVCSEYLSLDIADNITGLQDLIVDLHLDSSSESWAKRHTENIHAPALELDHFELSITGGFNPGDASDLVVYLENNGSALASNVNLTLESNDSHLDVIENSAFMGQIPAGSTGNNSGSPFHIISEAEIIPGSILELQVNISTPELTHPPVSFLITVGEAAENDPIGPDDGGYYCYDESDTGYLDCPEYDWIEINPYEGGNGTAINLNDTGNTGDTEQIDIPINFVFYDVPYEELSVCSNGWISPGYTENHDFMNCYIPGPGGPSPMIAPFWDDLMTSSGDVCYYHDSANHKFIVEWSNMLIDYSSSPVSFQVVIYDADYYPTSTGNSSLLFQYEEFNNDDQGSYGGFYVYHGQFATIGIENQYSTSGLQYTFNNSYPLQAEELTDGSAIFFTSAPIPHNEAYLVLFENDIIDSGNDGQLDHGETAEIKISISNIGELPATDVSAVAQLTDEYVTLTGIDADYPDIPGGTNAFPENGFDLQIADDCPNGHQINLQLVITYNDITVEQNRTFTISAPELDNGLIYVLNDDNNNNLADPGEHFDMCITIDNRGATDVYNPSILLTSLDPHLELEESINQLTSIPGLNKSYLLYPAYLPDNAQQGDLLDMVLSVTGDFGFSCEIPYQLSVGMGVEDFETGDFSRYPWETGGAADFDISTMAHNGEYAAQSGDIDDNTYTWLSIEIDSPDDGEISFWIKTSTENGWDYVHFYIDYVEIDNWSGETPWSFVSYDIDPGEHLLKWEYEKDAIVSAGSDCFWLDDITFPAASGIAPEIILCDTAQLEFELADQQTQTLELGLLNISQSLGEYEIRIDGVDTSWLVTDPDEGFLSPAQWTYVDVICNPDGLPAGEYDALICISDNFGHDNSIPVHLNYTSSNSDDGSIPAVSAFLGNYPNPFNPQTTFCFQLAEEQQVELIVYNIKGQKLIDLASGIYEPGIHQIIWQGDNDKGQTLPSGIYFARFKCIDIKAVSKVLLLK